MPKLTTKQICEVVEAKGLSYAIQSYVEYEDIIDDELAQLWIDATTAILKVGRYLKKHRNAGECE